MLCNKALVYKISFTSLLNHESLKPGSQYDAGASVALRVLG